MIEYKFKKGDRVRVANECGSNGTIVTVFLNNYGVKCYVVELNYYIKVPSLYDEVRVNTFVFAEFALSLL